MDERSRLVVKEEGEGGWVVWASPRLVVDAGKKVVAGGVSVDGKVGGWFTFDQGEERSPTFVSLW